MNGSLARLLRTSVREQPHDRLPQVICASSHASYGRYNTLSGAKRVRPPEPCCVLLTLGLERQEAKWLWQETTLT